MLVSVLCRTCSSCSSLQSVRTYRRSLWSRAGIAPSSSHDPSSFSSVRPCPSDLHSPWLLKEYLPYKCNYKCDIIKLLPVCYLRTTPVPPQTKYQLETEDESCECQSCPRCVWIVEMFSPPTSSLYLHVRSSHRLQIEIRLGENVYHMTRE